MSKNREFWHFFDHEAAPRLALRERTFRKIFEFLDLIDRPITMVETGCARLAGNWAGDGQSTVIFDKYISTRDLESVCYTVDVNSTSVSECKKMVSPRIQITEDDSVHYLAGLVGQLSSSGTLIDFLYLDSFDLDFTYWYPSAVHHLKELAAAMRCIGEESLVVVDDCPQNVNFVPGSENQVLFVGSASVGGKGRLVAEYAAAAGAKLLFAEYQAGWTGF
jgi:hypothetical protein